MQCMLPVGYILSAEAKRIIAQAKNSTNGRKTRGLGMKAKNVLENLYIPIQKTKKGLFQ